jgi:hypothetical protein
MKVDVIRVKLAKYYHKETDTILLEVLQGKPHSPEGGTWIEASVSDIERITEAPDFDRDKSGYGKFLDKWFVEGLITAKEKNTGKS